MKKIIPFKKDLLFKTKISEITSISLEHTLKIEDENIISGEFLITGDYKITEGNINRESFSFNLPFDIALNARYDINNLKLDIEDFYYEVINNEILKVNIDVYLEGEELEEPIKEEIKEELDPNIIYSANAKENELEKDTRINIDNINLLEKEHDQENQNVNVNTTNNINLINNIEQPETYATYHVYMVKEDDTLETIMAKYNVTKEDLSNYNDLDNIKPKDKIIIPLSNE